MTNDADSYLTLLEYVNPNDGTLAVTVLSYGIYWYGYVAAEYILLAVAEPSPYISLIDTFLIYGSKILSFGFSKSNLNTKSAVDAVYEFPLIASGNNVWFSNLLLCKGTFHNLTSSKFPSNPFPPICK